MCAVGFCARGLRLRYWFALVSFVDEKRGGTNMREVCLDDCRGNREANGEGVNRHFLFFSF